MKKLSFIVEGEGDVDAVPQLTKRIITDLGLWDGVNIDPNQPIRLGGIENASGQKQKNWLDKIKLLGRRPNVGGILAILDGDKDKFEGRAFCAKDAARMLAQRSKEAGAGESFSIAVVIARQEFESWLVAGINSLGGRSLPDGRTGIAQWAQPVTDTEMQPRDAKGWLSGLMPNGYKPTLHQAELAKLVSLTEIRGRRPRSFLRLEHAIKELAEAIRTGKHTVSPK